MDDVRLLVAGDLHYELRQLDWVLADAGDHDVVVLAGDLLDISSPVALEVQVAVVLGYLARLADRTTTVVCSGNHDLTARDADGEKAAGWLVRAKELGVHTDYSAVTIEGTRLSVCPWWDGPKGRAKVDRFLADEASSTADRWIWVYHWPPTDAAVSWTGRQFYGDAELARWIDRFSPDLVLSGHVHQSPWAEGGSWIARQGRTWLINAGRQIGDIPSHVVIDSDPWSARWWSYEGEEERSLAAAPA
jgi:Icc-related predicted phosphoesterase